MIYDVRLPVSFVPYRYSDDSPTQTPKALHPAQLPTLPRRMFLVTPLWSEKKCAEPGFVQNKVFLMISQIQGPILDDLRLSTAKR
jgi:hypothetical protein